jgi:hypothetical protein
MKQPDKQKPMNKDGGNGFVSCSRRSSMSSRRPAPVARGRLRSAVKAKSIVDRASHAPVHSSKSRLRNVARPVRRRRPRSGSMLGRTRSSVKSAAGRWAGCTGQDVNLGRVVALKALAPQFTGTPRIANGCGEARAAAGIRTRHLYVYALEGPTRSSSSSGVHRGPPTLREEIARHQAPGAGRCRRPRLADARPPARANGITHRDFKPRT